VEELKQINLELLEVLEKQKKRPAVDQSELLLLREKEERARNELLTEKGSHSYTLQQLEHHKAMVRFIMMPSHHSIPSLFQKVFAQAAKTGENTRRSYSAETRRGSQGETHGCASERIR